MDRPPSLTPVEASGAKRLLEPGLDAISFARHAHARALERQFNTRDVELTTGVVGNPTWDERFGNWTYRVRGTDLDGDDLTVIIALDPAWTRITIITGF